MSANMGIVCVYLCLCTMCGDVSLDSSDDNLLPPLALLFCPSFAHILPVTAKSKITLIVECRAFLHLVISITFEMNKTGDFNDDFNVDFNVDFVLFTKVLANFNF